MRARAPPYPNLHNKQAAETTKNGDFVFFLFSFLSAYKTKGQNVCKGINTERISIYTISIEKNRENRVFFEFWKVISFIFAFLCSFFVALLFISNKIIKEKIRLESKGFLIGMN